MRPRTSTPKPTQSQPRKKHPHPATHTRPTHPSPHPAHTRTQPMHTQPTRGRWFRRGQSGEGTKSLCLALSWVFSWSHGGFQKPRTTPKSCVLPLWRHIVRAPAAGFLHRTPSPNPEKHTAQARPAQADQVQAHPAHTHTVQAHPSHTHPAHPTEACPHTQPQAHPAHTHTPSHTHSARTPTPNPNQEAHKRARNNKN